MNFTAFGFVMREHAARKTASGIGLEGEIVLEAKNGVDNEIETQRDLEALVTSEKLTLFGLEPKVTSWRFSYPVEEGKQVCLVTLHYNSTANPLNAEERIRRLETMLKHIEQKTA